MITNNFLYRQHRAVILIFWLAALVCLTLFGCKFQPAGDPFYQHLARTVVRLELVLGDSSTDRKSGGTGFFVIYQDALYLVTARHVVDFGKPMNARIPAQRQDAPQLDVIELHLPQKAWVAHPSEPTELADIGQSSAPPPTVRPVDVAVARVPWPPTHQLAPIRTLVATDPEPPEQVLVFGYPHNLGFHLIEQRPLGREGMVAMVAKAPYIWYQSNRKYSSGSYADGRVLALDVRIFSGNSGSPVLPAAGVDKELVLLGLIAGGDKQLDIAVAEPASRIRETLEFAHTQDRSPQAKWLPARNINEP